MLTAYLVDDEQPALDRLARMLEATKRVAIVGTSRDPVHALDELARTRPEALFLDIHMPELSGFELVAKLEDAPLVVFTTAYDEYAIEAFDAQAIGYVLKPVRRERLERALEQAARLSSGRLSEAIDASGAEGRRHVCARARGELKLIPVADIDCFLADQKYVRVIHRGGEDLLDDSLKTLEEEFADRFVRIHRGALVALERIESLRRTEDGRMEVRLRSGNGQSLGDALVISRRHLAEVRRRLVS